MGEGLQGADGSDDHYARRGAFFAAEVAARFRRFAMAFLPVSGGRTCRSAANVESKSSGSPAEIDKWRQQGRALRKQLISEREILAAKVAEIDKRLATLPTDPDEAPAPRAQLIVANDFDAIDPSKASVAELVSYVLRHATRSLLASEIIESVQDMRANVEPEMVHSAIYRLKERERIEAQGEKGSRTFTWKGAA